MQKTPLQPLQFAPGQLCRPHVSDAILGPRGRRREGAVIQGRRVEVVLGGIVLATIRRATDSGGEAEGAYRGVSLIRAGWLLDELEAGRSVRIGRCGMTEAVIEGVAP